MPESNPIGNHALLTSWKEIAAYLGKGVRTVQRWEITLGLPVIRPNGSARHVVMARLSDLEAWILSGRTRSHVAPTELLEKDDDRHAKLAASLGELRRSMSEVSCQLHQVHSNREILEEEIRRFRLLYDEWNTIRTRFLKGENPPQATDVN